MESGGGSGVGIEMRKFFFVKELVCILSLYWRSQEKAFAWSGLAGLIAISLLAVAAPLFVNEWYKHFYNSVQAMDTERFYFLMLIFFGITVGAVLRTALSNYLVDIFAMRWRRWLTDYYVSSWNSKKPDADCIKLDIDNPDQRIAEDIHKFTFETIDLACGLIYTVVSIFSFSIVLINISGDAVLLGIHIPFYMFWAAIAYAILGTYASQIIGFRLIGLSGAQQRMEADLRYALVKFRDKSSERQLMDGMEQSNINERLNLSLANMRKIVLIKAQLTLFTQSYGKLSLIFSSLLAVPRFFSSQITFGELMQINSAFGNLYENLSWFINIYPRLADWKATSDRLIGFHLSMGRGVENNNNLEDMLDKVI
ncbi:SbmA/BacA-like family transporter [Pseudomonas syringae group genomosp. 3]|uniref:ABC transporter ATP-binding protein n=1 Tax=Pseudomonas syringae pv. primulae TaxID=251707 RepID=A0A3M3Y9E1_9PSED|nr:SbmA/BacA-like family transporter [Pseudomonas syringae group genomosp. 3]RMO79037.1 ABC transporter ATP-binding protein [Pseudomonas syringae pv. primulae]RMU38045.1 ABC transporter ATP-binding protein [Pseudomonas syringae pv. primulae]